MISTVISHYLILERLGAGGMGVVYKAQDTRLGRFVALKFLLEEFADDQQLRDRVKAGLRNAKAKGRVLGRPRIAVDARAVVKLRSKGHSWAEVSRRLNLSRGTAQRAARALSARG